MDLLGVTVSFDNCHGFISEQVRQIDQLRVTVEGVLYCPGRTQQAKYFTVHQIKSS